MYVVDFFVRWNGLFNEFDSREFDTLEEAKAFAARRHQPTIYKRIPSPDYMNSLWSFEKIGKEVCA